MWKFYLYNNRKLAVFFVLIKYYMTHSKISGKITKIKYKEINSEVWCCFFIDKYPKCDFLVASGSHRTRTIKEKEDEVIFWAKK